MTLRALFIQISLICTLFVVSQTGSAVDINHDDQKLQQVKTGEERPNELKLSSEQWDLARHGERLIQIPALKTVVNTWSSKKGHIIELRYPGGEEGELWVGELMDWLISLGIPSHNLVSVPGSGEADVIKFQLIKTGESYR